MSNTYTGEQVQTALDGLRAYGLAAGHPRAIVLDLCSEFKTQLAAQREDFVQSRRPRPKVRNKFYKAILDIFKELGWDTAYFIIESRKGWRRIKFFEYHRTHSDRFKNEAYRRIVNLIPRDVKPKGSIHYRGWERLCCHGDYDAFCVGIPNGI